MAVSYRDTKYELYTIGAVDPQNKHVWGFETAAQRESFLSAHLSKTINGCIYWKVDDTIKIDATNANGFSFENSYYYDYVRITNRPGTAKEFKWYCFIISRKYLNLNCTELTVSVDWVQTFYFNSNNSPWWSVQGYGVATTDLSILPPRGIGSEFPSLARKNLWEDRVTANRMTRDYCYIVYSTIYIAATYRVVDDTFYLDFDLPIDEGGQPSARVEDGVPMGSTPYLINTSSFDTNNDIYVNLNLALNNSGMIGAITGIFTVPKIFFTEFTGNTAIRPLTRIFNVGTAVINVPSAESLLSGSNIINPILKGYDYTYISVTNQSGEEMIYHYEDFNGNPSFKITINFGAGYPVMILCPNTNYKYGSVNQEGLFSMKQTSPVQGSMNLDNYMVWQAQNRNSIAASIDSAKLTLANAKEAQKKTGGIASMLDNMFNKAGSSLSSMLPNLGLSEEMTNALTTGGYSAMNSLLKTGMLGSFGLEASYVYNQQVKVAQQGLKSVEAQFEDKKYMPNTQFGSNAYGDLMDKDQYGFVVTVVTTDNITDLDRINESSGHICKGLVTCRKSRTVFDFWRMIEPKITNSPYNRPQFVNAMLTTLFNDGVYLWWYNGSDIDTVNFGHPYAITNTPVS